MSYLHSSCCGKPQISSKREVVFNVKTLYDTVLSKYSWSFSSLCFHYPKIYNAETVEEKKEIINAVKNGSVVSWSHVNFQGEYDLSKKSLRNAVEFNLEEIMAMDLDI